MSIRFKLCFLILSIAGTAFASPPSELYDPDFVLDSIVNPGEAKNVYAFDQWGNITLDEAYRWSNERNDWNGIYKTVMAYDAEGNSTLYESYGWDSNENAWKGNSKSISEYKNDKLCHAIGYRGGTAQDEWIPQYNNYFEYDAAGNTTYYEYNLWSTEKNDWVPNTKYIYEYGETNQAIMAENWRWDQAIEQWVGVQMIENEYSGVLHIILHKIYEWDMDDSSWVLANQTEGQWNKARTCWTLTEYKVIGTDKEPIRSILYYFNSLSSLDSPVMGDKYVDPFRESELGQDGDTHTGIFDLSGRMIPHADIPQLPKGIYIVNGKKVMK